MQIETIQSLNAAIAAKTQELKDLSHASGLYETIWNERVELIRKRDALLQQKGPNHARRSPIQS